MAVLPPADGRVRRDRVRPRDSRRDAILPSASVAVDEAVEQLMASKRAAGRSELYLYTLALNLRKLPYKPKEMNVAFDEVQIGREIGLGQPMLKLIGLLFATGALEMVDDCVRGNTEKPGRERSPAPLVAGKIGEGFVKHFGGEVFGDATVVDATDNEEIDAIEMKLVENIKFREVGPSRLDQQALVGGLWRSRLCRTSVGDHSSRDSNWREVAKVTEAK